MSINGGEVAIYCLRCPRTGRVRYVGKSASPERRLIEHLRRTAARTHKTFWIQSLSLQGLAPVLEVLEWVSDSDWVDAERAWIQYMRWSGCRLVNGTEGGDGGRNEAAWSPAARAKRASKQRSPTSDETKRKISEAKKGKPGKGVPPVFRGSAVASSKLTEEQVLSIMSLLADGTRGTRIAEIFGVTPANISAIRTGKSWAHLTQKG